MTCLFLFVYILVVVLSFGVIWELFEFGLDDTVRDLMFNSLGALVVAAFGQVHLSGVAETLGDRWSKGSS